MRDKKVVANTLLVQRAALKFLYVVILKQKWFDEEIACPKRRPTLPGILSPQGSYSHSGSHPQPEALDYPGDVLRHRLARERTAPL